MAKMDFINRFEKDSDYKANLGWEDRYTTLVNNITWVDGSQTADYIGSGDPIMLPSYDSSVSFADFIGGLVIKCERELVEGD